MFMEAIEKSALNGIATGVAAGGLLGFKSAVGSPFIRQTIPLPIFAAIVGATGSAIGDGLHIMMKDSIPVSKKFNDRASVVTGAAINGILFGGIIYAYQPAILKDFGMLQAFCVGAGAEVAGSAAYTYLKENSWL